MLFTEALGTLRLPFLYNKQLISPGVNNWLFFSFALVFYVGRNFRK